MSLSHLTTISTTHLFSSSSSHFPSSSSKSLSLLPTKSTPLVPLINKKKIYPHFLPTSSLQNQQNDHQNILPTTTHRRTIITTLGGVLTFSSLALTTQTLKSIGSPNIQSPSLPSLQKVEEFGSQPKQLKYPIRVLVQKPRKPINKSKKEEGIYVLEIDNIEVPNNEPVRFDVYVKKPRGDEVNEDLGEFVGSFVDLARSRVGRNQPKSGLNLGISCLLKEIGAENVDKLVVSLIPRFGDVIIGGVHLDYLTDDED